MWLVPFVDIHIIKATLSEMSALLFTSFILLPKAKIQHGVLFAPQLKKALLLFPSLMAFSCVESTTLLQLAPYIHRCSLEFVHFSNSNDNNNHNHNHNHNNI